jgi:GNAT superfamily N-acetyltransferase
MYIRRLLDDEYDEVIKLISETVHSVCKNDYSEKELDAWAPANFDVIKFRNSLKDAFNIVAFKGKTLAGFLSIERNGYINRLYTHKDFQRTGIATSLFEKAQNWASENGIREISLDSSKTAEGFYLKMGFIKAGISVTQHGDVVFRNTVMKKLL